jgi:hypothetical protein
MQISEREIVIQNRIRALVSCFNKSESYYLKMSDKRITDRYYALLGKMAKITIQSYTDNVINKRA